MFGKFFILAFCAILAVSQAFYVVPSYYPSVYAYSPYSYIPTVYAWGSNKGQGISENVSRGGASLLNNINKA
ncbi:unnamed protein product [Caenorhabditis auriculariae]|uniref:Nematode Specific Peptide family, group B n=1 Tax=Caenorhabditis auriculariae TaxID=2777116 RepID=A0A8S1H2W9_9PELO|nr:unnamed protein product [Caenorhabditis auriculariae]